MTLTYEELHRRTRERDRSLREKVMSLAEAAALVPDGASVGIGGSTLSRTPMAMIWALIRAGRKDLVCSRSITSSEGELLFASGASRHILTSWFSQGIVWGVSRVMRLYTETSRARFEEWSHMAVGLRFRAGAMGLPFLAVEAVVEVPFGCAPHECYGLYEPLFGHLDFYAAEVRRDPEEGMRSYLERYFYGPKSWTEYLGLLGLDELLDASRRGKSIYDD